LNAIEFHEITLRAALARLAHKRAPALVTLPDLPFHRCGDASRVALRAPPRVPRHGARGEFGLLGLTNEPIERQIEHPAMGSIGPRCLFRLWHDYPSRDG